MRRPGIGTLGILIAGLALLAPRGGSGPQAAPARIPSQETIQALQDSLKSISDTLRRGAYAEGERMSAALQANIEAGGFPDTILAACLDLRAESRLRGGLASAPESRALAERAISLWETARGRDHPSVAFSLVNLGWIFYFSGQYDLAVPVARRALDIRERSFGPESAPVASCVNLLASLHFGRGEPKEARSLYARALAINEKTLGPDHPAIGGSLNNLAAVLQVLGEHAEAKPLLERAIALAQRIHGPEHPEVANPLTNLGNLLRVTGDYDGARANYERALAIKRKALGEGHPDVALGLSNLGIVEQETGNYSAARPLYERALEIRERALGPDHPDVAETLNNLANHHFDIGDYAGAIVLYRRAVAIQEKASGPESHDVALILDNMANAIDAEGRHDEARPLYERTLRIRESALGEDHPEVAANCNNLGDLLVRIGDDAGAMALHERALRIFERSLGPTHPHVATTLGYVAEIRRRRSDLAGAMAALDRADSIRKAVLDPRHPHHGVAAYARARIHLDAGDADRGIAAALASESLSREHFRLTIRTLGEGQALRYAAARPAGLHLALSMVGPSATVQAKRDVLDAVIRSRAMVLDEVAGRQTGAWSRSDPRAAALRRDLMAANGRLARLLIRGPDEELPEAYRDQVENERKEKDRLERALAERSAPYRAEVSRVSVGLSEVERVLPAGSALVSYVLLQESRPGPTDPDSTTGSYRAFVLRSGSPEPLVAFLGSARDIDSLVGRWRSAASRPAAAGGKAERSCAREGRALRHRVWDPVSSMLHGAERVVVVPDGSLQLVNMAAWPSSDSTYLVETGPIFQYVSAERDLVPPPDAVPPGIGLIAMGGASFDDRRGLSAPAPPVLASGEPSSARPDIARSYRGGRPPCTDFREIHFEPLPGAAREAEEVATRWGVRVEGVRGAAESSSPGPGGAQKLTGRSASESAFKRLAPGCRAIHLATHGFVLAQNCSSPGSRTRGIGGLTLISRNEPPPTGGASPLLLAGLALAGANHRERSGPGQEDGILTAEEISSLDLSGVELATLSACDTGLGEIRAGEGVLGLRRAFRIAGVRSLVMSLWGVEDRATREWMGRFYDALWIRGLAPDEAAREASRATLKKLRSRGWSTHPFTWGAFVAVGSHR